MANRNEIRYRLGLDGDEEVKKKLDGVADHGKNAFKDVNETIGKGADKTGDTFDKVFEKVKKMLGEGGHGGGEGGGEGGGHGGGGRSVSHKIRETLHTVHPIVEEAELQGLGKIGSFALAARAGIQSLAIAIGGSLIAALEKLGDETNDQIARLASFTGSFHGGREAREELGSTARDLELPAAKLAPVEEQLLRANQKQQPDQQLTERGLQDVIKTLFNGADADRVPLDKAVQSITGLLSDLRENGQLTPEAKKSTAETLTKLMVRLLDALSKKFPDATQYTTPQVLGTLQEIGPQVAQDAATTKKELPGGIGAAWTKVEAASERLAESFTGGTFIAETLEKFAHGISNLANNWDTIVYTIRNLKPPNSLDDLHPKAPTKEQLDKLPDVGPAPIDKVTDFIGKAFTNPGALQSSRYDALGNYTGEKAETAAATDHAADDNHGVGNAAEHAAHALDELGHSAEGAEKKLGAFVPEQLSKQLAAIGSRLSTDQAKLDYQSKPEENAIKLDRDRVAVENAQIQKQQALLAAEGAKKGKEQAALAPETARENLASAHSGLDAARIARLKYEGYDTSAQEAQLQRDKIYEAEDNAQTAVKRAQIEKKYAHLEPQRAELAGQKAETDIRSADYLERDSKLTLAKDESGQKLSTDVAGLRYAQAQLDEEKTIAKLNGTQVELLTAILNKISNRPNSREEKTDKKEGERAANETDRTVAGEKRSRLNGEGPTYRIDENGDRVDTTLADVYHFNKEAAARRAGQGQEIGPDQAPPLQPEPLPLVPEKHSEAEPAVQPQQPEAAAQPQQLASLGSQFQDFISAVSAALSGAGSQDNKVTTPGTLGIRGEGERPAQDAAKDVAELGTTADKADSGLETFAQAAVDAASKIESAADNSSSSSTHAAGGGYITGPGTSTSDSIDARLSHGEFVVNARQTAKHKPLLHAINDDEYGGGGGYADGGFVDRLSVMGFADGGLIDVPHLAVGGPVTGAAPTLAPSVGDGGMGSPAGHYSVDLRTNHGDFSMMAPEHVAQQMSRAAVSSASVQAGPRPSWYGK